MSSRTLFIASLVVTVFACGKPEPVAPTSPSLPATASASAPETGSAPTSAAASAAGAAPVAPAERVLEGGLKVTDLTVGTGKEVKSGDKVVVHYTGKLEDGYVFDSSHKRKKPFEVNIGVGRVIKGWDKGIVGMKEGGKRKLVIPPALGYGDEGTGTIPPRSTLTFEVDLLEVK